MSLSIKNALQSHDREKLGQLLKKQPELSNAIIKWGDDGQNRVTPLHYLSDLIFLEDIKQQQAIAMAEILIHYGADLNMPNEVTGDSPLISASSLGAENYALWLLSTGADYQAKGLFGATVLHWRP